MAARSCAQGGGTDGSLTHHQRWSAFTELWGLDLQVYDHTSGGSKYYYFGFCWSGCVTTQANIKWIPNEIQNLEEVHDQGYGPSNQQWGSQVGGGSSNPVSYSNMMWWDFNGINLTPAMSIVNEGFSGIYATQPIGSSMSVFDGRCSS